MDTDYSENIDRQIHDEVNQMGSVLGEQFGFHFPTVTFDQTKADEARRVALQTTSQNLVDLTKARLLLKEVFHRELPGITLYINTTPFSTWNTNAQYISLSIQRFPDRMFESFCHEANHYLYDLTYGAQKYQDTAIKETITVLNTLLGVTDHGWPSLKQKRARLLAEYEKSHSFQAAIDFARRTWSAASS